MIQQSSNVPWFQLKILRYPDTKKKVTIPFQAATSYGRLTIHPSICKSFELHFCETERWLGMGFLNHQQVGIPFLSTTFPYRDPPHLPVVEGHPTHQNRAHALWKKNGGKKKHVVFPNKKTKKLKNINFKEEFHPIYRQSLVCAIFLLEIKQ